MRAIIVPLSLGALATLACSGNTQDCDDGEVYQDGQCVKEGEEPFGDADTDTDTDTDSDSDTGTASLTGRDVQMGELGTVTLEGVVVVSGLTADGTSFWVQDEGGGEWSGLRVYLDGVETSPVPGQVVDLTGLAQEYYDETELLVADAADIEVRGSTALGVTPLSRAPSDWESYEGVLVELLDVEILSDPDGYGESVTSHNLTIDDAFFPYYDGFGPGLYDSITGPIAYTYEAFKVEPRSASDISE